MLNDILAYQGVVIRPPSEADSLILQATLGCSDNNCTFCPAYKQKKFRIRSIEEITRDIKTAALHSGDTRKVFLADGDAIVVDQGMLIAICDALNTHFPKLARIAVYASAKSLARKSVDDLCALKSRKLGIMYLGIESGDPDVYALTRKQASPEENVAACLKIKQAGIKVNTTVILGLGSKKYSSQHALNTARVLNEAQPDQVAALTLMVMKEAPIHALIQKGEFALLDRFDILQELHTLIEHLAEFRCQFFSNHASNYLPLQARFPRDKKATLDILKKIIENRPENALTPDWLRGL